MLYRFDYSNSMKTDTTTDANTLADTGAGAGAVISLRGSYAPYQWDRYNAGDTHKNAARNDPRNFPRRIDNNVSEESISRNKDQCDHSLYNPMTITPE